MCKLHIPLSQCLTTGNNTNLNKPVPYSTIVQAAGISKGGETFNFNTITIFCPTKACSFSDFTEAILKLFYEANSFKFCISFSAQGLNSFSIKTSLRLFMPVCIIYFH